MEEKNMQPDLGETFGEKKTAGKKKWLLAAGIVLYSLQPRLPDGVIGYADGPTALYVTGLSPLPLPLGGAAAVLAAIGGVLLWRAQRQKGGRR